MLLFANATECLVVTSHRVFAKPDRMQVWACVCNVWLYENLTFTAWVLCDCMLHGMPEMRAVLPSFLVLSVHAPCAAHDHLLHIMLLDEGKDSDTPHIWCKRPRQLYAYLLFCGQETNTTACYQMRSSGLRQVTIMLHLTTVTVAQPAAQVED